jgi:hypothetical protein
LKKVLLQLDVDRHPSAFDSIVALDAGADELLRFEDVNAEDVAGIVQGSIFTRGPKDLANIAIFVGGGNVPAAQQIFEEVGQNFFGPFRVSAMLDPNGSNTTAVAAVLSVERTIGTLKGKRALVLAGVGPVGTRTVSLLARSGAHVRFTGSNPGRLEAKLKELKREFGDAVEAQLAVPAGKARELVEDVDLLIAAGPEGVELLKQSDWADAPRLQVAVDLNAVPPLGLEGIEVGDDGVERNGKRVFGAFGVGKLKMKLHKRCIAALFEANDRSFDAQSIFELGHTLLEPVKTP